MDAIKNFGIQPTLLLAQIVNFLIILFLLRKFFFGPITKMLDDRKKRIEESLKNADFIEEKLEKTKEESKKIIDEAQKNAQQLLSDAKAQAQNITTEANEEAKKIVADSLIAAQDQIKAEKEKAQNQVQEEAMLILSTTVKKVLGRTMSKKEKEEMTKVAIKEMPQIT